MSEARDKELIAMGEMVERHLNADWSNVAEALMLAAAELEAKRRAAAAPPSGGREET